jgi:hypothetical protein
LLNYAEAVQKAARAKDGEHLAWLKFRLSGAHELYEQAD